MEKDDDEEYEIVIYNGPDAPYEILEEAKQPPNASIPPNIKLELMNARLAQMSAEYGGLLTPHFFLQSPGVSSSDSSRDAGASTDVFLDQELSETSDTESQGRSTKTPFTFPIANLTSEADENYANMVQKLERIEILEDDFSEENEMEWVEWPKRYIETKGFCLGVQPGNFYKNKCRPCFYVKLPHRSKYEVYVTNNNQTPCDLDLYVNGQPAAALRLPAGTTRSIDGPQYSKYAFKLFRTKDVPPEKKVTEGSKQNGIVKAVFTPCKVESSRLRSVSAPLRTGMTMGDLLDILDDPEDMKEKQRSITIAAGDEDKVERSLDVSRVVEGVTLLQGKKKKKNYVLAPEMETDPNKRVILQLRLIASLDEEVDATDGEIYDFEPPPLPSRK